MPAALGLPPGLHGARPARPASSFDWRIGRNFVRLEPRAAPRPAGASDEPPDPAHDHRGDAAPHAAARPQRARSRPDRSPPRGTPGHWFESDPLWFKTRGLLRDPRPRLLRRQRRRHRATCAACTEKLDYLQWLGVDCIWLLPMYPSPAARRRLRHRRLLRRPPRLRHASTDFRSFVDAAHRRGIRVIADLVDEPHLERPPVVPGGALEPATRPSATGTSGRTRTDRYPDARIIFVDTETSNWTWDPVAGAYYWHRFFSHQPDLNYDNPEVQDGDARGAALLARPRASTASGSTPCPTCTSATGTNCENLPETHAFLKRVRQRGRRAATPTACCSPRPTSGRPTSSHYFGDGDECHMAFHFPVMPRMFMALRREDATPIVEILAPDAGRSPRTASGASSCATTTS